MSCDGANCVVLVSIMFSATSLEFNDEDDIHEVHRLCLGQATYLERFGACAPQAGIFSSSSLPPSLSHVSTRSRELCSGMLLHDHGDAVRFFAKHWMLRDTGVSLAKHVMNCYILSACWSMAGCIQSGAGRYAPVHHNCVSRETCHGTVTA